MSQSRSEIQFDFPGFGKPIFVPITLISNLQPMLLGFTLSRRVSLMTRSGVSAELDPYSPMWSVSVTYPLGRPRLLGTAVGL